MLDLMSISQRFLFLIDIIGSLPAHNVVSYPQCLLKDALRRRYRLFRQGIFLIQNIWRSLLLQDFYMFAIPIWIYHFSLYRVLKHLSLLLGLLWLQTQVYPADRPL